MVSEAKHLHSARITAHLRHDDVFVSRSGDDGYLAVRDVFDALAQRLRRVRDVRKSRAHGALNRRYRFDFDPVVH